MIESWLKDRGVVGALMLLIFKMTILEIKFVIYLSQNCVVINQKLRDAILHLVELQQCENEYLVKQTESALRTIVESQKISRERFAEFHEAIRRRCLAVLLQRKGIECSYDRIIAAAHFILTGAQVKNLI
jgi:tRNA(Ile)-lysidine synthase